MGYFAKHRQPRRKIPALFKFWGLLMAISATAVLAILSRPVVAVVGFFLA